MSQVVGVIWEVTWWCAHKAPEARLATEGARVRAREKLAIYSSRAQCENLTSCQNSKTASRVCCIHFFVDVVRGI